MARFNTCGRCNAESDQLRIFQSSRNDHRRERLCGACHSEAKENRGLTAQQIAAENQRWERIYREKFEDPGYYAVRFTDMQSSFSEVAFQLETLCGAFLRSKRFAEKAAA